MTLTLAELYARQGLMGKAREIWRQLAEGADPAVASEARRKLAEQPSADASAALLQELLERIQSARRRG